MRRATTIGLCFVLVLGLCAVSARAADKAVDLIVGKWEPKDTKQKGTVEFTKEGKILLKVEDEKGKVHDITGTYKFTGEDKMEVELNFMDEKTKEELKVTVTKEELTTTDSKDKKETFKKVK